MVVGKWFKLTDGRTSPDELGLDFSYPDVGGFLPVAILCGIAILFTVL
jgi:hypothetical protein